MKNTKAFLSLSILALGLFFGFDVFEARAAAQISNVAATGITQNYAKISWH